MSEQATPTITLDRYLALVDKAAAAEAALLAALTWALAALTPFDHALECSPLECKCGFEQARALLAELDGGAAEAGEALGLNMAALREAFHATRWCKDGARGHAFAHGDDPEDIDARGQFLAAYLAAQRDAEAER